MNVRKTEERNLSGGGDVRFLAAGAVLLETKLGELFDLKAI